MSTSEIPVVVEHKYFNYYPSLKQWIKLFIICNYDIQTIPMSQDINKEV